MKGVGSWVTVGAALLAVGLAGPGWGADWGVVDMGRIAAEYRKMQELDRQFQEFQRGQERRLEERQKTRLLFDEEQREFLDVSQMGAPTEETAKRLAELEQLCNSRERQLFELRRDEQRTPEEEAEFQRLSALYDKRMAELAALQGELQTSRETEYEKLSKLVTDNVDAAVKAVAEAEKMAIVVRKEVVLYGGTDITDEVLAKLNAESGS